MQSNAQWLTIEADSIYFVNVSKYLSVTVTQTKLFALIETDKEV